MDVLQILQNHLDEVELADLELLEVELQTGNYSKAQIKDGFKLIDQRRLELQEALLEHEENQEIELPEAIPNAPSEAVAAAPSDDEKRHYVKNLLNLLRISIGNPNTYMKAVLEKPFFAEDPVGTIAVTADIYSPKEMNVLLLHVQFGEELLQKYWSILDLKVVSRHQCFSEDFFMKHFSELDTDIVLHKGPNPWRKPDKMSKKLSVFLKLKGVKL